MDAAAPSPVGYPAPPVVEIRDCPIATSLQFLGRKWTLTILRDVAFFPKASFGLIRKRNRGITARTLSLRLRDLVRDDYVRKVVPPEDDRHPYYELTEKGSEIWPILAALFQFGSRHHAERVFPDGRPRTLSEVYPHDASLMLGPVAEFARSAGSRAPGSAPPSGAPRQLRPGRRTST